MKITAQIIGHIREFIRARHFGNIEESGKHQMWLKHKLMKNYSTVLLKHGDPDYQDGYLTVMQKWCDEERGLYEQGI